MLEDEGIDDLISSLADERGEEFLQSFLWRLQEYAGENAVPDDVSGILLEFDQVKAARGR